MSFALGLIVKATLLLALALLGSFVLRRRAAELRFAILGGALLGVLLLPLLSLLLPPLRAPLPGLAAFPALGRTLAARREWQPIAGPSAEASSRSLSAAPVTLPPRPLESTPALLAGLWLAGLVLGLTRLSLGRRSMRTLVGSSRPCSDPGWLQLNRSLAAGLGLSRAPRLLVSAEVPVPLTWGALRPLILLPECAEGWPASRRRAVLLHELAHVKRRDCVMEHLAGAACALYWFHPAVWYAARRLRVERELACDASVVLRDRPAVEYAAHLVEIAAAAAAPRGFGALPMAQPGGLERRVKALLDPEIPVPLSRRGRLVLGISAPLLLGLVSATRPERPVSLLPRQAAADSLEFRIEPDRTVEWSGPLAAGDTLSVRAAMGSIAIDSSTSGRVELYAVRKVGPRGVGADTRIVLLRSAHELVVCSVHLSGGRPIAPCRVNQDWGHGSVDDNDVSFRISVPPGVYLDLMTGLGDLAARRQHRDVRALTGNGFADIETDAGATVEAYSGGIVMRVLPGPGLGPITLSGKHGRIDLLLPPRAEPTLSARTGRGAILLNARIITSGDHVAFGRGPVGLRRSIHASLEKGDIRISQP